MKIFQPLAARSFRIFWASSAISVFGDHLTFIALPWLVLKLTGDPLAMGTVIAVAAVPRAVFMLFGGALSDRWSPRTVMLWSNLLRFVLVAALAVLTYAELIDLWSVLIISFLFGLADAFLFPAASAMPPRLLEAEQLTAGNSLLQGTFQVALVLGPMTGGLLIATFGDPAGVQTGFSDRFALAAVFALDALTFVVSLLLLTMLRERFVPEHDADSSIFASILDGLQWAWRDMPIRIFMLLMAALSLVFRGPFMVGVPALAEAHLEEGAAAYGVILSSLGIGAIIGTILAGTTRRPGQHWLGTLLLIDFLTFGIIMILMAHVQDLVTIASVVLIAGVLDGYVIVFLITWTQSHVPAERLGRVMSVVMFVGQGLFPVSSAIAGAIAGWDLMFMLMFGGTLAISVSLLGLGFRQVRRLGF
jgi:MFS family permease